MKIRAIVAGMGQEEDTRLEYLLGDSEIDIRGRIKDPVGGIEILDREKPELLLVTGAYDRKMQAFCHQVYILYPQCAMVIIARDADMELYNLAMGNGIRRLIHPIPDRENLISQLKEVYIDEQTRHGNIADQSGERPKTEVLFVFGAKGGIGKTALAVNLATHLAMSKRKVILLDCNLQFGDTGLYLGMEPKQTLAELLQEQRNPTLDTVNSFLSYHQSGLRVLFGPKSPEYAEIVGGTNVDKVVSVLRNYYDYIVIDGAVGFSEVNLSLLDLCNRILFVTQPDLCALKNSKKAFLVLQSLNLEQKIKLAMVESKNSSIKKNDVERVLGHKVEMVISSDEKTMAACLNQGRPVVMAASKSRLASDYGLAAGMVERGFVPAKAGAEQRGSRGRKIPGLPKGIGKEKKNRR